MIPTPPLRPRNRLAELICSAVSDERARRELETLAASSSPPPGWCEGGEARWAALLLARARRAVEALAGHSPAARAPSLAESLEVAAALFDAGLYFEVHELLEPHWRHASGAARQAVQGLIQVSVGYQHLANGNLAGAHALLAEGVARLSSGCIEQLDAAAFAAGVEAFARHLPERRLAVPPFPRSAPAPESSGAGRAATLTTVIPCHYPFGH